jgi:antitoxin (DNA-binding transcriptional repressor) of toxin-antitoxin stability system
MKTFTLHDLQTRTADLIDHAKGGESSWITYQGKPLVMAVSCGFDLADTRMATALATGLYLQEEISLGGPTCTHEPQSVRRTPGQPGHPVLRISATELARDLALFDRASP